MNQAGRDALRAAGLAGVVQIFGNLRDEYGGRCGLGVMVDGVVPIGMDVLDCRENILDKYDLAHRTDGCPLCTNLPDVMEYLLIGHLNDTRRCDFFKIAELMPVTDS